MENDNNVNERPGVSNQFLALCVGALLGGLSGLIAGVLIGWFIWGINN